MSSSFEPFELARKPRGLNGERFRGEGVGERRFEETGERALRGLVGGASPCGGGRDGGAFELEAMAGVRGFAGVRFAGVRFAGVLRGVALGRVCRIVRYRE